MTCDLDEIFSFSLSPFSSLLLSFFLSFLSIVDKAVLYRVDAPVQVPLRPACLRVPGGADETIRGRPSPQSSVALLGTRSGHVPETMLDTEDAGLNKRQSDNVIGEPTAQGGRH